MWHALPSWWVLAVALLAPTFLAPARHGPTVRTLVVSENPAETAHRIYVLGKVVTVLRFEQPCDPARTQLLGWEGRFEPMGVTGRHVVLMPLRNLGRDERAPLLVTLADGTEVPFLLAPPPESDVYITVDQQVDVFKDRESYEAVLSSLKDALKREQTLEKENARFRKEETSADHALATLLASGDVKQTFFESRQFWSFKEEDAEMTVNIFSGKGKAAVLFKIKNQDPKRPWKLAEVRLTTAMSGHSRMAAIRSDGPEIQAGKVGAIAVVADRSAFMNGGGPEHLVLEIFRNGGLRQAYVLLDHRLVGK